jgi:DNA mismatch endonuclease (patch repair protein)
MDQLSKAARSALMSRIPSRANQSTELAFVHMLRTSRINGWRQGAALLGNPDFVFPQKRVASFVGGYFWHGSPRCNKMPQVTHGFLAV